MFEAKLAYAERRVTPNHIAVEICSLINDKSAFHISKVSDMRAPPKAGFFCPIYYPQNSIAGIAFIIESKR